MLGSPTNRYRCTESVNKTKRRAHKAAPFLFDFAKRRALVGLFDRRRISDGRGRPLGSCLLGLCRPVVTNNCGECLRDLVRGDIALVLDDLIDQLEAALIKALCHQHAVLVDRHRVNAKELVLYILDKAGLFAGLNVTPFRLRLRNGRADYLQLFLGLIDVIAIRKIRHDPLEIPRGLVSLLLDQVCVRQLIKDLIGVTELGIFIHDLAKAGLSALQSALLLIDRERVIVVGDAEIMQAKVVLDLMQPQFSVPPERRIGIVLQQP